MKTINTVFNSDTGINKIEQFDHFETWPANLNSMARLNTRTVEPRFFIF